MYDFKFYEEAEKDLAKLNNSVKKLFVKKLTQIIHNPEIGKNLGNKNNLNLTGLKKAYFDNKRYIIVYEIIENKIIIHIIAIGKRDNMKVYKEASNSYEKYNIN